MFYARQPAGVTLKSRDELNAMRKAGRLTAECLQFLLESVRPGMCTQELDDLQMDFARRHKVIPAPLNYKGFPKSLCTSINEVICHGIPSKQEILKEGDIVGIDVSLIVDGFFGDSAATVAVGTPGESVNRLLHATLESLRLAIAAAGPGKTLGDIGHAIQSFTEPLGYSVVRDFVGHGIGREFHEPPQVPHYGIAGRGIRLKPGMTFTIEPMINIGTYRRRVLEDGWTAVTLDGKPSAQFEHTVAVTPEGMEILTSLNDDGFWMPPGGYVMPSRPDSLARLG
jgi:methionyl aminopeptidase